MFFSTKHSTGFAIKQSNTRFLYIHAIHAEGKKKVPSDDDYVIYPAVLYPVSYCYMIKLKLVYKNARPYRRGA